MKELQIMLKNNLVETEYEIILYNTISKKNSYSEWETMESPIIKITQENLFTYQNKDTIECAETDFKDHELDYIAKKFNEHMDLVLKRALYVNARILMKNDESACTNGTIYVEVYTLKNGDLWQTNKKSVFLNNNQGFVQIQHIPLNFKEDVYLKISEIELKFRNLKNKVETIRSEVKYETQTGIVKATSDSQNCPYFDIQVSKFKDEKYEFVGIILGS